jgi:hypothetical protein
LSDLHHCHFTLEFLKCITAFFYSETNEMHQFLKFILLWNNTLHVSDGLSVHHQEFKTVHTTTGICRTDTATCMLALFQNKINLRNWFI